MAKANSKKAVSMEEALWKSADKLRGSVEPAEYKHVVLSLIFLKYASDRFEEQRQKIIADGRELNRQTLKRKTTHTRRAKMKRSKNVDYDENVDYDSLEQHTYDDTPGEVFYTCPICGGEYLATFITEENGQTMCIDCWSKRYGD